MTDQGCFLFRVTPIYHTGRKLTNNMLESALLPKSKTGWCTSSTFPHFPLIQDFSKGQGYP